MNIVWTPETVAKMFEVGPMAYTPGTKMPEQKIGSPEDRQALVEFWQRQRKNRIHLGPVDQDFWFSSYSSFSFSVALAQVIVGGAYRRALGSAERIELLFRHDRDPAVGAHLDDVEPLLGVLEHPVRAFELGGHALDRTLDAERLAAADAGERFFLLDDAACRGSGAGNRSAA